MAEEKITISKLPYQVNLTDDMALPVEDLDATYSVGIGDLRKHLNSKLVEMVDTDFDNLRAAGTFLLHGTSGNAPADAAAAYLVQVATQAGKTVQIAVGLDDKGEYPATFKRRYTGAEWTPWTSTNTQLTPWAINSGHAVNGQNAIMSGVGTATLSFDTSEAIIMTSAEGVTAEVSNIAPITPINNGEHNIFYDIATSEARVYANKVYIQDAAPEAPQRFDVWLDTSKEPLKCFQYAGSWTPRQLVWLGSVKVEADNIVELKNRSFNVNGANQLQTRKDIDINWTVREDIRAKLAQLRPETEDFYTVPYDAILSISQKNQGYCMLCLGSQKPHNYPDIPLSATDYNHITADIFVTKGEKIFRHEWTGENLTYLYPCKRKVN